MALLTNINGKFSVSDAGAVTFNNAFTFPTTDGTANYVLKTNGSGTVSWSPDSSPTVYWAASGNNIYNTNSGQVSIGSTYVSGVATRVLTVDDASNAAIVIAHNGATALSLYADGDEANIGSYLAGANMKFFTTPSGGGTTERMRIDSSGNVGIGETGPTQPLHILANGGYDKSSSGGQTTNGILIKGGVTAGNQNTTGGIGFAIGTGTAGISGFQNGTDPDRVGLSFYTHGGGTGSQASQETMRIMSGGEVGIGTTLPGAKLEVNANSDTLTQEILKVKGGGSGGAYGFLVESNNGDDLFKVDTLSYNSYFTNGKVGIGTTSPATELQIGDYTDLAETITIATLSDGTGRINFYDSNNTEGGSIRVVGQNLGSKMYFSNRWNTDNDRVVFDLVTGNVGIGTASPTATLDVHAPSTTAPSLTMGAAAGQIFKNEDSELAFGLDNASPYNIWMQGRFSGNVARPFTINPLGGNVGIGVTSPSYKLEVNGNMRSSTVTVYDGMGGSETGIGASGAGGNLRLYAGGTNRVTVATNAITLGVFGEDTIGSNYIQFYNSAGTNQAYIGMGASTTNDFIISCESASVPIRIFNGGSERMRITSGGAVNVGSTGNFSAGKLVVQQSGGENGGIVTLQNGGTHGYYTRVCHNATSTSQAGYWHIKTNIPVGNNIMFIAKFYGYIYGSAQVLDLSHAGYAYSGTNTVINQGVQNNGNNTNASSAIYTSANGSKVTFRIAFGAGATFSTYFAGVYMDMAFPSPAGQGHDFLIEAQSFSQSTTVY